jgi:hypothetical protein
LSSSSTPDYPAELLWNGRGIDDVFSPEEFLYYRVQDFNELGKVNVSEVRFPDTSVNRGKYSSPEHVLFAQWPRFVNSKVAQMQVKDIPANKRSGDGTQFDVKVVHNPVKPPEEEDENYAHSEICCFVGTQKRKNVPDLVRKFVRQKIADSMRPAPISAAAIPRPREQY